MKGNVTGGILLFTLGALIIGAGVTEKGKQILGILTGETSSSFGDGLSKREDFKKELEDKTNEKKASGGWESTGDRFGFAGERGATVLG